MEGSSTSPHPLPLKLQRVWNSGDDCSLGMWRWGLQGWLLSSLTLSQITSPSQDSFMIDGVFIGCQTLQIQWWVKLTQPLPSWLLH